MPGAVQLPLGCVHEIRGDSVRLLVDNYEAHPESDDYEASHVYGTGRSEIDDTAVDFLEYESALDGFMGNLQLGVLEYLEQARNWINPVRGDDPSNAPTNLSGDGISAAG
jgi:hypothetical protein